ncbi:DUF1588 domain-containing protein [Sorangium sp. So ce1389]|uniref:DUF1588 domain-containing protein n=1 Tax=Sorangium sp. So ce1389 TaxID=3133336 RepID=UPI003F5D8272
MHGGRVAALRLGAAAALLAASAGGLAACGSSPDDAARSDGKSGVGGSGGAGGQDGVGASGGVGGSGAGGEDIVPPELPDIPPATPEVIAPRLTRFLWNDAALAGEISGRLGAPMEAQAVQALAREMLQDPRARDGVGRFFGWWLRSKLLQAFTPEGERVDDPLLASMRKEVAAYGSAVVLDEDGTLDTLMLAPYTFVDARLAEHYGMSGVEGEEPTRVPYGSPNRMGLFTSASIMRTFRSPYPVTWPVKRGWLVRSALLCAELPDGSPAEEPRLDRSIREQMIEATAQSSCAQCHNQLNPPGFAFLRFDSMGRELADDAGEPFDTSGWVTGVPGEPRYSDVRELLEILKELPEVHRCVAQMALHYATDPLSASNEGVPAAVAPRIVALSEAFGRSGRNLRELIIDVVGTPEFLGEPEITWGDPDPYRLP